MKFTIPSSPSHYPTINWKPNFYNATSPDQPRTTLKRETTQPTPHLKPQPTTEEPPFTLQ